MKILMTGGTGFLGYHTRVRLRALTEHDVILATRENWAQLSRLARGADAIIHIAGINRGAPNHVEQGNIALAKDVAEAAAANPSCVRRLVFANSIWAGSDGPYGVGKAGANAILATSAAAMGAHYVDVKLPNLFGENGRPDYNSFVATFVDRIVSGGRPPIVDRQVHLLHAQSAAQALIDGLTASSPTQHPRGVETSVQTVYEALSEMKRVYQVGDIPPLRGALDLPLFNTLRAAMFPQHYPIPLAQHKDARGALVETVKARGVQGQTFVSTTHPGFTRGDHFHLQKIERFAVIRGKAQISLRRVLTNETVEFNVSGDEPTVIDMPTMWVHNITNIGSDQLITLFWANELFNSDAPDTFWEPVAAEAAI